MGEARFECGAKSRNNQQKVSGEEFYGREFKNYNNVGS
jgi:hypothetical protein